MEQKLRILLIEDDTVDRMYFQRSYKSAAVNAELSIAEDAATGIQLLSQQIFDCIFLDYMLPGIDGLDLLKKLHDENPTTSIVLITSHGDEKIAVEAMKSGALDYIPKSLITPESLAQIIRNIVRLRDSENLRLNAEKALKQSEKYHRTFFENTPLLLCTHDLYGNIISVNYATAKNVGYTAEELVGANLKEIISPRFKHLFDDYLKKIKEKKSVSGLMQVITKSGEERIWMYHNCLYEDQGDEAYVVGGVQDITERVKMEEELHKAKELAEESVKTKEQFLANMSHEIRTPMNAIIGFTDLLLKTNLNEEQKRFLDIIHYSGQNLLVIINDILDFSKIKSGKLILEEIDFNLPQMISSLISMLQPKANEKNIQLYYTIDSIIPLNIKGDTVRLNQILVNLLNNAIKFTDNGHIALNIKSVIPDNNNAMLEFCVEDTGIGIDEDKLESIFESFTQASNDTTRKYGGTGLGLAIVKNLVELQGGKIRVSSTKGRGTKFIFNIPLKKGVATPAAKLIKNDVTEGSNLENTNVLLVEDNKVNQALANIVLNKMGCKVAIAENGKEAIEKLKTSAFDIILMDIQMPVMDGYEATRYIRTHSDQRIKNIPIIAITAHALSDEGSKCLKAGMNDYISKPFDSIILFKKIQNLIPDKKAPCIDTNTLLDANKKSDQIDLTYIKKMLGEDDKVVLQILNILCDQLPPMLEEIRIHGINKNWKLLKLAAHKMKSSIMIIRMDHFQSVIESIEKYAAEENKLELIPELIEEVITTGSSIITQIKIEQKNLSFSTI